MNQAAEFRQFARNPDEIEPLPERDDPTLHRTGGR